MYQPNEDRLIPLADVPRSSVGAPSPVVLASEQGLFLLYLRDWPTVGGSGVPDLDAAFSPCAVIRFERPRARYLGPPNDEACAGHPLHARGLRPYGAYEVVSSSWIAELSRRNAVHTRHDPARYAADRHFIFTFHDSTFECIARGFTVSLQEGPLRESLRALIDQVELAE
jgi:hypothetical protein